MEGGRAVEEMISKLKEKYRVFAPKGSLTGLYDRGNRLSLKIVVDEKSHFSKRSVLHSADSLYFENSHCAESKLEDDREILIFARPAI